MNAIQELPLAMWLEPPSPLNPPEFAMAAGFTPELWAAMNSRFPDAAASAAAFDAFLNPRLSSIPHPFDFPNVRAAAEKISAAIDLGAGIVVFGDFDADGVVATAILTRTIRRAGGSVTPFIPRRDEGYGLTEAAMERCLAQGKPSLMVTVDCGITAGAAIGGLAGRGIDVIVTDHHIPGGAPLPGNVILCAPSLPGTPPQCSALCGAGVAFALSSGIVALRHPKRDDEGLAARRALFSMLDALAIATVADIVPLSGLNRTLVALGLRQMNSRPSTGVKQLLMATMDESIDGIDARDVAFILGPHVNSAGRMATAGIALELLLADDPDAARLSAVRLKETNALRKSECARVDSAIAAALAGKALFDPAADGAVVVAGRDWAAGVIGLSAAHLCERFSRPAIVISLGPDGVGRGSVRAPAGYNVHDALDACSGLLMAYGGHESAAGLTLAESSVAEFRRAFSAACAAQVGGHCIEPALAVDAAVPISSLTIPFADAIASMAPFGEGNPEPVFRIDNVSVRASAVGRPVPKGLRLALSDNSGCKIEAVWFGHPEFLELFNAGGLWSIAANVFTDSYSGARAVKLRVVDAAPAIPRTQAAGTGVLRTGRFSV